MQAARQSEVPGGRSGTARQKADRFLSGPQGIPALGEARHPWNYNRPRYYFQPNYNRNQYRAYYR